MSDWRIRRAYGWGAGRVCLAPEPARSLPPTPTLVGGLRELGVEVQAAGLRRTLGLVGGAPALALFAVLLISLLATLARDPTDVLEVEVVAFELPPDPTPEPPPPEPTPPPVRVASARPSPGPPPPVPPPEPPPEVVRASAPPPEPPPRPEPPARPRISVEPAPELARAEPPSPEPVRRAPPRPELAPPPVPPPSLAIDPLAAPAVTARAELPAARRALRAPSASPAPPDVAIDPLAAPSLPSVPRERVARASRPAAPHPGARVSGPAPVAPAFDLAVPAAPTPDPAPLASASRRSERPSAPAPARSGARTDPPKGLAPAAFDGSGAAPVSAPTHRANRTARVTPAAAARDPQPVERLEAVPLSALAACVSDREEDRLKLDVLGAVGGREECSSPAGRYRFVETKNLNAFLMWIERSASRARTDRCIELRLALECLHGAEHRRGR